MDLLDIRGTMNVYTKADSTLAFRTCSFTGAMNFNSYGEQSGKLTLTNVDGEAISFNEDINGPLFNMFGGNVAFDVGSHNNLPFYTKYNMSGGTLYLKAFYLPTNFVLTGGTLINDVMFDWGGPARNAAGQELHNYTVTLPDITAPTAITQMGGSAWSGLYTDETGEVTLWTPETFTTNDEVYYFYTADTCYKLFMENSEIVVEKLDAAVHTVTFNMPDGSTRLIQIYDGGNVELPAVPEAVLLHTPLRTANLTDRTSPRTIQSMFSSFARSSLTVWFRSRCFMARCLPCRMDRVTQIRTARSTRNVW